MKILVEHDASGEITAVIAPAGEFEDGTRATFASRPGRQVTELDAPHIKKPKDYKQLHEQLHDLRTRYRVEAHQGGYRLVSK